MIRNFPVLEIKQAIQDNISHAGIFKKHFGHLGKFFSVVGIKRFYQPYMKTILKDVNVFINGFIIDSNGVGQFIFVNKVSCLSG